MTEQEQSLFLLVGALHRNLVARMSWQRNAREGGRVTLEHLLAAQLLYWF